MYKAMQICFKNAGEVIIEAKDFTDYDLKDGFLMIFYDRTCIAMYAASEIFSLVLVKEENNAESKS